MRSDTQQERTNVWLARSVISDSADRGDNSHKSGLDSGHSQGRVRERTQIRAGRGKPRELWRNRGVRVRHTDDRTCTCNVRSDDLLAFGNVKVLQTNGTLVCSLTRNEPLVSECFVSSITRLGATGPVTFGTGEFSTLAAVIRLTHATVIHAVVTVRFLKWHETVLTKVRTSEKSSDVRNGVKVFLVLVVQKNFLAFLIVVGADVRKLIPHTCTDDI